MWVGMEISEASAVEIDGESILVVLEIDGSGIWFWWSSWGLAFTMKVGMVGFDFGQ